MRVSSAHTESAHATAQASCPLRQESGSSLGSSRADDVVSDDMRQPPANANVNLSEAVSHEGRAHSASSAGHTANQTNDNRDTNTNDEDGWFDNFEVPELAKNATKVSGAVAKYIVAPVVLAYLLGPLGLIIPAGTSILEVQKHLRKCQEAQRNCTAELTQLTEQRQQIDQLIRSTVGLRAACSKNVKQLEGLRGDLDGLLELLVHDDAKPVPKSIQRFVNNIADHRGAEVYVANLRDCSTCGELRDQSGKSLSKINAGIQLGEGQLAKLNNALDSVYPALNNASNEEENKKKNQKALLMAITQLQSAIDNAAEA